MTTKHYTFGVIGEVPFGRVAVKYGEDEKFIFASINGAAPPVWVLGMVLTANPEIIEASNDASMRRQNGYAIVYRVGMSGARDFRLLERRDDDLLDYPTRAHLHVSMYGKLNEGVRMWQGDLVPIIADMIENHGELFVVPTGGYILEQPTRSGEINWMKPASKLLAVTGTGQLSWDNNTDGAETTITEDMPLWLGNETMERLLAGDFSGDNNTDENDGLALADWQIIEE